MIARSTFYAPSTLKKKDPRISHYLNNKTLKKSWIMNKNLICIRGKKRAKWKKGNSRLFGV